MNPYLEQILQQLTDYQSRKILPVRQTGNVMPSYATNMEQLAAQLRSLQELTCNSVYTLLEHSLTAQLTKQQTSTTKFLVEEAQAVCSKNNDQNHLKSSSKSLKKHSVNSSNQLILSNESESQGFYEQKISLFVEMLASGQKKQISNKSLKNLLAQKKKEAKEISTCLGKRQAAEEIYPDLEQQPISVAINGGFFAVPTTRNAFIDRTNSDSMTPFKK
ncbi:MAG: hypothetical protein H2069_08105 [Legionella sp.]|nr:hypothetical protein [Legionella sp.]